MNGSARNLSVLRMAFLIVGMVARTEAGSVLQGPDTPSAVPPAGPHTPSAVPPAGPDSLSAVPPAGPDSLSAVPPAGPDSLSAVPPAGPDSLSAVPPAGPDSPSAVPPAGPHTPSAVPPAGPDSLSAVPPAGPHTPSAVPPAGPDSLSAVPPAGPDTPSAVPPAGPDSLSAVPPAGPDTPSAVPLAGPDSLSAVPPAGPDTPSAVPPAGPDSPSAVPPAGPHTPSAVPPAGPHTPSAVPPAGPHTPSAVPPAGPHTPSAVPPAGPHTPSAVPPAGPDTPSARHHNSLPLINTRVEEDLTHGESVDESLIPRVLVVGVEDHRGDVDDVTSSEEDTSVRKTLGTVAGTRPWPNATVPYQLAGKRIVQRRVKAVMADLESKTCLRFMARSEEKPYLLVNVGRGNCWTSSIGYPREKVTINLGLGCRHRARITHELLHALGFLHEHSRPDRDHYVAVNWDNIMKGTKRNFVISRKYSTLEVPYDYGSIMHYGDYAYAVNRLRKAHKVHH
ncbi:nascent polypeptide-associated complex subunit alpha, muscle-specific form-like isoform X2 [Procambarus clarkii]|uniref:nascent polypeptide-associated complex subunit alpha, muscle-specific form-like isoform X2 n=1 Tax=Procambarus clarkii TaxID=6728 RepID=UPI0037439B48